MGRFSTHRAVLERETANLRYLPLRLSMSDASLVVALTDDYPCPIEGRRRPHEAP